MSGVVVVLSGPVSSGKTTLARRLAERFGATHMKTSQLLDEISEGKVKRERRAMQQLGSRLDRGTDGAWVADGFAQQIEEMPADAVIVIDAVRTLEQIEGLRSGLSSTVVHVHLTAPRDVLERRYAKRPKSRFAERASYAEVLADPTEKRVPLLADDADVVIDTGRSTRQDVAVRAASYLGLNARDPGALVDVIVGGQFGSEGKGNIAYSIGPEYDLLCRVGGPNAGHKVPLEKILTHRLLPSATLSSEAPILIGPGAVLDIDVLFNEIAESEVEYGRLHIDPQAMIIRCSDIEAEGGLVNAIGSTGKGVGVATARRITDRGKPIELARDVKALEPFLAPTGEILADAYSEGSRILLEGTQGSGLSLYHGSYPHVTSRDTTAAGCLAEMGISPSRVRRVIMVCRTYPIRVQSPSGKGKHSGPMSQPTNWKEISRRSGIELKEFRRVEKGSVSKKQRRVSEFDWDLLRWSAELNGATDIALTFVDYLDVKNRDARRFDQLQPDTIRFIEEVERVSGAPVSLISTRFHLRSVIDRRAGRKPEMKPEEITAHYPRLFHMANVGSWPSIHAHGLLSTRSLVDLYGVDGKLREEILSTRRGESIPLHHAELGTAVVRDQLPLREMSLEKCLTDMTLEEWLETLNSRVFFWLDEPHLEGLLGAKAYREDAHDVIIIDTAALVDRDGARVRLSPINSGSTLYNPRPRGSQTFMPIEDYPFAERRRARGKDAIVELAVEDGVERVEEVAVRSERRRCGGVIEEVLWERP